ncbi:MAG TPA: class I SAM-dependent methyltransferase [Ignavibacteriales bacterium]|nr:class I SAM-dependent methyltransferase [Ignavibacteriales bacterium]
MTPDELEELMKDEPREFIREHMGDDPDRLALKFGGNASLPIRAIAEEIRCIKKARVKLPRLSEHALIYEKTALEQASSELTAGFKASLFSGRRIIDLTGGLGIDDIFFSRSFKEVLYCEQNPLLTKIFEHNIHLLGISNIKVNYGSSIEILQTFPENYFDLIYADPARRDLNRRFIGLKSCSPDVVELMPKMLEKSEKVLIKASPAIEFEEVKREFSSNLKEFIVVSVDNECREVLLLLERNAGGDKGIIIRSVLIDSDTGRQRVFSGDSKTASEKRISPGVLKYFYEPDSAVIKARLSTKIAEEFSLFFLNRSVDYLTSEESISNFPGRTFEVINVLPYRTKEIKFYLSSKGITSANISRRDFPDPPEKIRKLLGLKDGGAEYLFFTKDSSGRPIVILCRKHKTN